MKGSVERDRRDDASTGADEGEGKTTEPGPLVSLINRIKEDRSALWFIWAIGITVMLIGAALVAFIIVPELPAFRSVLGGRVSGAIIDIAGLIFSGGGLGQDVWSLLVLLLALALGTGMAVVGFLVAVFSRRQIATLNRERRQEEIKRKLEEARERAKGMGSAGSKLLRRSRGLLGREQGQKADPASTSSETAGNHYSNLIPPKSPIPKAGHDDDVIED